MIKFLKNLKYKALLKKHFEPRKEFSKQAKILFIKELQEKYGVNRSFRYKRAYSYVLTAFLGLFILGAGAAVFAEKENVNPNHPLYTLKRLAENIQVKVTSEEKKPMLYNKFAKRRLQEVKTVKEEKIIQKLNNDFHEEVGAILKEIKIEKDEKEEQDINIKDLCETVLQRLEEHDKIMPNGKEQWSEYKEKCQKINKEQRSNNNKNNNSPDGEQEHEEEYEEDNN